MVLSFAQMEGKCYYCGKPAHTSPNCHSKNKISREDWYIHKVQGQHHAQAKKEEQSLSTSNISNKKKQLFGWAGVHYSFIQAANMQQLILLDSDSSETFFLQ